MNPAGHSVEPERARDNICQPVNVFSALKWAACCLSFALQISKRAEAPSQMLKNYSSTTEFYLLGFPGSKELHNILFATFFFFYSVTLIGNMVIILTVCVDKRLQSPMYFFLGHLSVLEILITSVAVPLMLWGLLLPGMQAVSLSAGCVQLYLYLSFGT